jgi:transaldolase
LDALKRLHESGQSIWLDNITRGLLTSGTLERYIGELSVSGLTSNPTIFERAISGSRDYDDSIKALLGRGSFGEALFFELAIEDLAIAADQFLPAYEASAGADGYVSLEVSPELAHDTDGTVEAARRLHARANRRNLLIKVPGTPEGVAAIEELIFRGVPINVTLLFSTGHWAAAAEAYTRGIERRLDAGESADVASVASLFISRWDRALTSKLDAPLQDRAGIAIGHITFAAATAFFASERWQRLAEQGARPQRLLWASTGTKNPDLSPGYYLTALAAAGTVNTVPEDTLLAFHADGAFAGLLGEDASDAEATLRQIGDAGVDLAALAAQLQADGRDAFAADFEKLLRGIDARASELG